MGNYQKYKSIANNFFELVETTSVNLAIRKLCLWRLKKQYLKKEDYITSEYKKDIKKYWGKYTKKANYVWHKYYSSRNGIYDVRYIPDDLYYTVIDQHFNNRKFGWGVNDKNYYKLWFDGCKQPEIVIHKINNIYYDNKYKIISKDTISNIVLQNKQLIIKPAVETGGSKGIVFWNRNDGIDSFMKIITGSQKNLVVQKIIKQHDELNKIHPNSVNTIRIISLILKGKVNILSAVLRMGINGNKVDNASAGGITCGIKENGQLKSVAYSAHGIKYDKHPQGYIFENCVIPSYDKVIKLVKEQHIKMAHFRMISWDIAIDASGEPILIEANLRNGECDFHQFNNGPLFGDLTDDVLSEVFNK